MKKEDLPLAWFGCWFATALLRDREEEAAAWIISNNLESIFSKQHASLSSLHTTINISALKAPLLRLGSGSISNYKKLDKLVTFEWAGVFDF